jgi:hypothetical protein
MIEKILFAGSGANVDGNQADHNFHDGVPRRGSDAPKIPAGNQSPNAYDNNDYPEDSQNSL